MAQLGSALALGARGRRFKSGHPDQVRILIADLASDPELSDSYVTQYVAPRRASVWHALQRGVERGELCADTDFAFVYDLLVGPLFMRAVVWGQPLPEDAAEKTADVVVAAFAPKPKPASASRRRSAK